MRVLFVCVTICYAILLYVELRRAQRVELYSHVLRVSPRRELVKLGRNFSTSSDCPVIGFAARLYRGHRGIVLETKLSAPMTSKIDPFFHYTNRTLTVNLRRVMGINGREARSAIPLPRVALSATVQFPCVSVCVRTRVSTFVTKCP